MKVALFIPCYMNIMYARASLATYKLLEQLGLEVIYPQDQSCCGQISSNMGCSEDTKKIAEHFFDVFGAVDVDYIVIPSGSCASMIRNTYSYYFDEKDEIKNSIREKTYELTDFLISILKLKKLPNKVTFPHPVSVHFNCHALRHLHLGTSSELIGVEKKTSSIEQLLNMVEGVDIKHLENPDECCGFGGTFALKEEIISKEMGLDRINEHIKSGSHYIVSSDVGCLMHQEGLKKRNNMDIDFLHIAQILVGEAL